MKHKVCGALLTILNLYILYSLIELWHLYNFTSVNFYIMIPSWILGIKSVAALIGIFLGLFIYYERLSPVRGILISLGLLATGQLIELLYSYI